MRSFRLTLLLTALGGASGCGSDLAPVEGTVTLDDKPLAGAQVMFQRPTGPIGERVFQGETDAEGRYAIKSANNNSSGAPPGSYRIMITSVKVPPDADELTKLPPERVPPQWRDGSQSFDVPEEGTNTANFALKSR